MTFWVSSKHITVFAEVNQSNMIITGTAPITRRFVGKPLGNLTLWMARQGGLKVHIIKPFNSVARIEWTPDQPNGTLYWEAK
jgi:hypothetical protein